MKAALYARYSTDSRVHRHCEVPGRGHVRRHHQPARLSATARLSHRREFDAFIAEESSRLWRNMAEQAPRLAELRTLAST